MNGTLSSVNWPEQFPDKPQVWFSIECNKKTMNVRFKVKECETLARATHNFDKVWMDSCCELFIMFEGESKYYNLETSCNGYQLFAYRTGRFDPENASEDVMEKIICKTSLEKHATFGPTHIEEWSLDIEIPAEAFWHSGIKDFRSVKATGNIYKCNQGLERQHFLSWAPIQTPKPDFHCPEFFRPLSY